MLCTLNARYIHTAFGLRYLYANLSEKNRSQAQILEFTLEQSAHAIVEEILKQLPQEGPRLVGFGVYIWNTRQTAEVLAILKRVAPDVCVVIGGPEVSYEFETQPQFFEADFVFKGESDFLFRDFCDSFFEGSPLPTQKVIAGDPPPILKVRSPYSYYTDQDIQNRILYVEASRGCPYKCEYCLSSLDKSVRSFDLNSFLNEMNSLIARGARSFKFVDRTFNLSPTQSTRILEFFLAHQDRGLDLFLHFEMVPDRLPDEIKTLIQRFKPGSLQFEVGIQTFNPQVSAHVSRRQDLVKLESNLRFLNDKTGVHVHADLIAGLPGEDLTSFAQGFDRLASFGAHEIQVGILKRLKGTPISRHDQQFKMVYDPAPPFQILKNKDLTFEQIQGVAQFSKIWDRIGNSGHFVLTLQKIRKWALCETHPIFGNSLFGWIWDLSIFLQKRHGRGPGVALLNFTESLWIYLSEVKGYPPSEVKEVLLQDYSVRGRRDIPHFLKDQLDEPSISPLPRSRKARQERHLAL